MNKTSVDLKEVKKSFHSGSATLQVLKNINLSVEGGKSVSIVGASGSGKSTLLNLIGGLESPDSGNIFVSDYHVSHLGERDLTGYRRQGVGLVFQFHYLLKDFTTLENVMLPLLMTGCPRSRATKSAYSLLERVHVDHRANHYPSQLSGGERQRGALARALINDPPLVLADEPTGNLDEASKESVNELLFSLAAESGKTLIIVTHSKKLAENAEIRLQLTDGILSPV